MLHGSSGSKEMLPAASRPCPSPRPAHEAIPSWKSAVPPGPHLRDGGWTQLPSPSRAFPSALLYHGLPSAHCFLCLQASVSGLLFLSGVHHHSTVSVRRCGSCIRLPKEQADCSLSHSPLCSTPIRWSSHAKPLHTMLTSLQKATSESRAYWYSVNLQP